MMNKDQARAIVMQNMGISDEELSKMEQWAIDNCTCPTCPTYTPDESKLAFCIARNGQSEVISNEKNCVCGQCPVFNEWKFHFAYYCTRDSEVAQTVEMGKQAAA